MFYKILFLYNMYSFLVMRYFNFFTRKYKLNFFFPLVSLLNLKLFCYEGCLLSKKFRNLPKFLNLSRFRIKEYSNLGMIPNLKKYS